MQALLSKSALSLFGVNLAVIALAIWGDWSLPTVLASYWLQSVIIGLFQARKMWELKVFSTEGLKMNGQPVDPTPATKRSVVLFFLFHYGIFHAAYAGFILAGEGGAPYWPEVLICGAFFFANHLYSYWAHRGRAPKRVPNIGGMMFFPYIRIVPMHIFILLGAFAAGGSTAALVVFMVLKTIADETMHAIEHRGEAADDRPAV